MIAKRRALISVSDKRGLIAFAKSLQALSFEIVSTGGTATALRDGGLSVIEVSDLTGFPEIMDGRVKTLHPRVHAGLLARRGVDDAVLAAHGIEAFDLLVVNLYPFEQTAARRGAAFDDVIENIDVGGPAMLRAAAKNHGRMTVVVDAADYATVADAFAHGVPDDALRLRLAAKAFAHTARYDAAICRYLFDRETPARPYPTTLVLGWDKAPYALRYGENPHQSAALYLDREGPGSVAHGELLQGKPLSYNNLLDADAAVRCAAAFLEPACVIVKHMNPCGVAISTCVKDAYDGAYAADPTSAFGGIIAFNRVLDEQTAAAILGRQVADVIAAPAVAAGARAALAQKPNIRVIATHGIDAGAPENARETGHAPTGDARGAGDARAAQNARVHELELRSIAGGVLVQQPDDGVLEAAQLQVVTQRAPTEAELRDLLFAWKVVKHVKSNAIVYAREGRTLGIGAGQTSRVMSARIAGLKAEEQGLSLDAAVMASDAFFPFRDGLDVAAALGIRAVIQPGGSLRDKEIVAAADEHGMAMVLTGMRHFRH